MKKVRLTKKWENDGDTFAPGIYEVDEDTAKELIANGLAVAIADEDEDDAGDEAKALTAEDVALIVKQALAGSEPEPVRKLPAITVTKDCLEDDPNVGYRKWNELGFGMFLRDVGMATVAVQSGKMSAVPERLIKAQRIMAKQQGLNESVGSEGDFLVPTEQRNELLKKVHDNGMVFNRARVVPMTSKSLEIPMIVETSRVDGSRHGGVRAYWVGEGTAPTKSKPSFGKVKLVAHKLMALGYLTEELQDDAAIGALQLLGELFAEELSFKLDDSFVNGTGGGQAMGILNANALISVTRNTPNQVNVEDIVGMYARSFARGRGNSVWFMNQDIEPQLLTMVLTGGTASTPVYLPPGGLSDSPFGRLLGRPVVPIEQCATLGTVGDILFCDMSQYLHGQRRGVESAQSIHVQFTTDELTFKARMRADGQPWWGAPLTPFKGTNTQSPFVALAA